jgi:hypothetical protein
VCCYTCLVTLCFSFFLCYKHDPFINEALTVIFDLFMKCSVYVFVEKVSNDVAFNALIEICGIESKCLFDSIELAEQHCFRGSGNNLQMQPDTVAAYDLQGGQTSVNNGNKFYSPPRFTRNISFGRNVASQLAEVYT